MDEKTEEIVREKVVPTVKIVVGILGLAAFTGASVIMPATPVIVTPIIKYLHKKLHERETDADYHFDSLRLRRLLQRLEKQKDVRLTKNSDGSMTVELTEKGRAKHLKYKLEDMERDFNKKNWDGKWRIICFDVPEIRRTGRDSFRRMLGNLKFYQLQKSVYLTPFPCQDEIEYLRSCFGLGDQVQILITDRIENDRAYRLYFGLT
jgi:hypothetical protein